MSIPYDYVTLAIAVRKIVLHEGQYHVQERWQMTVLQRRSASRFRPR
jgi:hypothetical protein